MTETAVVLANDSFRRIRAKTAHGMVRGPSRYRVLAVVDATCAGSDAGELLDGRRRGIPIVPSLAEALRLGRPDYCVLGVATAGGKLPAELRGTLAEAARAGLSLVNGMHELLSDDEELVRLTAASGARIIDLRKPRPVRELRFWTGDVDRLETPVVAVLGTDCAVGKRTTCMQLREALRRRGVRAEAVYTGQTGWLQGMQHGFLLDATANDFVSGELEGAVLACARELDPEVILLEGQSALRNPSGPCGSELILSAGARAVVLQHAPGRSKFHGHAHPIPPIEEELQLIRLLGAEVWALTLNEEGLDDGAAEAARVGLEARLGVPVFLPLRGGSELLARLVAERIGREIHA